MKDGSVPPLSWSLDPSDVATLQDPDLIYQRILHSLLQYAGARRGFIAVTSSRDSRFRILSDENVEAPLLQRFSAFPLNAGSEFTQALNTGSPFILQETMSAPLHPDSLFDFPLLTALGTTLIIPVHEAGGPVALVALDVSQGWSPSQLGDLQKLAQQILPPLQRAQLLRALRSSELHAATILRALEEGVLLFDMRGALQQANAAAHRITGITDPAQFPPAFDLRWQLMDPAGFLLPVDDYPGVQALRTGVTVRDTQVLFTRPDGRQLIASLNAIPLMDSHIQVGVVISFTDITHNYLLQQQLEAQALHDPLTGLPNRRQVTQLLRHLCSQPPSGQAALILIGPRNYASLLDRFGQRGADVLQQRTAQRLEEAVAGRGVVTRISESEFLLITTEDQPDRLNHWTQELVTHLSGPYDLAGTDATVIFSLGYVLHPDDGLDPDRLLHHAGLAFKEAAAASQPTARRFDVEMAAAMTRRLLIDDHLHRAVETGTLSVQYQPVMTLPEQTVHSLEALLRWHDPSLGNVSPAEFIPVAERSGLIHRLGSFVLQQALREAVHWNAGRHQPLSVNVNVSVSQFRDGTFPAVVQAALTMTGARPDWLTLEVTEAVAAHDLPGVKQQLDTLRATGVRVALDDFGTGYSSLALLSQLPFDVLKLDRLFVQNVHLDARRQSLLRSVIQLGMDLGFTVVSEGIELPEELAFVQACGCTHVQGFLLARPQSPDSVQVLLNRPA